MLRLCTNPVEPLCAGKFVPGCYALVVNDDMPEQLRVSLVSLKIECCQGHAHASWSKPSLCQVASHHQASATEIDSTLLSRHIWLAKHIIWRFFVTYLCAHIYCHPLDL